MKSQLPQTWIRLHRHCLLWMLLRNSICGSNSNIFTKISVTIWKMSVIFNDICSIVLFSHQDFHNYSNNISIKVSLDYLCKWSQRIESAGIGTTAQKMKFSSQDFFSKCDQIRSFLRIWSHLLKKPLIKNFIFCAVYSVAQLALSFSFV